MSDARRQFNEAVKSARRYLDSAQASRGDPKAAFDYLMSAADAVGSAVAHLSYLPEVNGKPLAQVRGLQDRIQVLKKRFVAKSRSPAGQAKTASALKRRLT